jgi:phage gp45-like
MKKRLNNLFKFGRLKAHDLGGNVQVEQLSGEIHSDLEHPQEFGFASKAPTESQTYSAYRGGNQESGAVLIIAGRAPIEIAEGDTVMYSAGGATIHCTGAKIELSGDAFGGLIKINDLTTKLNLLAQEFDTHQHAYFNSAGLQITSPPASDSAGTPDPATPFTASDYENEDINHG